MKVMIVIVMVFLMFYYVIGLLDSSGISRMKSVISRLMISWLRNEFIWIIYCV